jgi:putative endonuclease
MSYYVYILSNVKRTVFYIGITNNLRRRIYEYKEGLVKGFSQKYYLKYLVYFEEYPDINEAIIREKQLKNWHRQWKINLIRSKNPKFDDLVKKW